MGRSVFLGDSHAHVRRDAPPGSPNFGTFYMRAHSVRNNNKILHGDQTRCEETFYTVDHECWRAICLRQLTFLFYFVILCLNVCYVKLVQCVFILLQWMTSLMSSLAFLVTCRICRLYFFLLLIDNLSTQCLTHKYVDDTTLSELYSWLGRKYYADVLPTVTTVDRLKQHANKLFKDQEMILGPLAMLSPQPLSCNSGCPPSTVERVQ